MDRYKETFETWNKVAVQYQELFMDLDLYTDSYDLICNSIPRNNPKILELGCGPGNITKYLLSKRPDFEISGTDIAPNMIALAKKNNPQAAFACMDCRHIDSLKTKFDGIVCGFCLPYLSPEDSQKLISDCADLLNDNGLLYISFVAGDPAKSDYQSSSTGDRSYFYFHDLDNLKATLTGCGFGDLTVLNVAYKKPEKEAEIHTIITAKKI